MPVQDLWAAPTAVLPPQNEVGPGAGRETDAWRVGMIALTVAMVFFPARAFYGVLNIGGMTFLDATTLVLFILLFAWLAFAFVQAATGFCLMVTGGARILEAELALPDAAVLAMMEAGRTALLMPIYNEDVAAVFARLQAVDQSLAQAGAQTFDIFILSDTRDEGVKAQEGAAFQALRRRISPGRGLYYRSRVENIGRKAGNIADWVRTFGGAYETMVVLDADSLMEGEMLVRLAAAMARRPTLGLIQTVPLIVNRTSLFARVQQFASRLYGPMLSEGLAWWSGSEGNYWGHNAIIRTRAFAEQAGLPRLPGRKPFGGEILSHDFVEAALLRRGGWDVRMAPQLYGSFEECPPSLPDLIVRERRWCQGNLQHSIVIAARGLHWNSRLHMMRGVSAYLTTPVAGLHPGGRGPDPDPRAGRRGAMGRAEPSGRVLGVFVGDRRPDCAQGPQPVAGADRRPPAPGLGQPRQALPQLSVGDDPDQPDRPHPDAGRGPRLYRRLVWPRFRLGGAAARGRSAHLARSVTPPWPAHHHGRSDGRDLLYRLTGDASVDGARGRRPAGGGAHLAGQLQSRAWNLAARSRHTPDDRRAPSARSAEPLCQHFGRQRGLKTSCAARLRRAEDAPSRLKRTPSGAAITMPQALGLKKAFPNRQVISLSGDGGLAHRAQRRP